jgi:hypothetical protein
MARKDDEKSYLMGRANPYGFLILSAMPGSEPPMSSAAEKISGNFLNRCEKR